MSVTENSVLMKYKNADGNVDIMYPVTLMENVTGLEDVLADKANAEDLSEHLSNTSNPHGVTAAQVGAIATHCVAKYSGDITDVYESESCRYVISSEVTGMPIDDEWWFVDVLSNGYTDATITATLVSTRPEVYVKTCINDNWGDWRQVAMSDHTHDQSDINGLSDIIDELAAIQQLFDTGIVTEGDGTAYTATIEGLDALEIGQSFIMIPHTVSTVVNPTLNVNGLGAKYIRVAVSNNTTTTVNAITASFLGANKPIRVTYNGTFWVANIIRPYASDLYGTVTIANGGTGATDAATARTNLGVYSTDEVDAAITAAIGSALEASY